MAFHSKILTQIYGRRFGLQRLTTNVDGITTPVEVLVGPEALRTAVTTAETTSANLAPYGMSFITSAVSSGVYTLDPPVPGVSKTLTFTATGATAYVKTANNETIYSASQGTSATTIKSTQNASGALTLHGVTTASWALVGAVSSALYVLSTST